MKSRIVFLPVSFSKRLNRNRDEVILLSVNQSFKIIKGKLFMTKLLTHLSLGTVIGEAKKIVFHSSEDFRGFEIQLVQHDWSSLTASTVTSNRSARLRAVRQLLKEPSKTVVDETPLFDGRCYRCNVISLTLNLIFPANFDHLRLTREQQG
ncbi:hypothetical protein HOLleu_02687 [Holothuria leucospilota]|uniref:Uncharacterized protein n=1 Tax=Holothuria leucospilota TaxID=206669 RepID=A0A9Q1CPY8_HOLLE|nr:hypothetical protein HOLleu_02687 [Holothuria leucospilota]